MEKLNKNENGVVYIAILENVTYPLAVAKSLEELESKITDYFGSRGKIVAKHASKLKFKTIDFYKYFIHSLCKRIIL